MKRMRNIGKVMVLMAVMMFTIEFSHAATYYLTNAGNASSIYSWKPNSDGTGTSPGNFTTIGDEFIIPVGVNAIFTDNKDVDVVFGPGVTLRVEGSMILKGAGNTTTLTMNGTIIFTKTSGNQLTYSSTTNGNNIGKANFVLGANATLTSSNQNGIVGTSCSIVTPPTNAAVTLPPTASYVFNGGVQSTAGLPTTVANLTISGSGTKTLAANATVSGILTITSGSLDVKGYTATVATLEGSGILTNSGSATTFTTGSGVFSGIISGALSLNKTGSAILTLSGENAYTGATTISEGTLQLGSTTALGTSSLTTVASTATLDLNGVTLTTARPLSLSGTLANSVSTAVNYDGAITLGGASTIAATGNITLGGGINGLFSLTKTGTGILNTGTVPSEISALTISAGNLTIPAGAQVTVAGATAINVANGLTIESLSELSGGAGTGSFITGTATTTTLAGTITTTVRRHMSPKKWHMVSSPVSEGKISDFLVANPNIPNNTVTDHLTERGMRGYDPSANEWTNFYTNTIGGDIETGKGFLVRVKSSPTYKEVVFKGTLQADNQSATGLAYGKWNCVGNPYTSALKLNSTTADNFIDLNEANLDLNFGGIYIWKQENAVLDDAQATGAYEAVTNASELYEVQQGQAFMVKMADATTATSLNFTRAMQSHNTGLELKSTSGIWPTIKLTATVDSITSSTVVAFHEGMTAGLDPTYDAGLLKGGAPVEVYTRLVEDNGIPFDIQALPTSYESTVVPVGLDCAQGDKVSFSAELMHVPSACQVLLEDRLNKVFTDLSVNSYTADLMGATVSKDRFFLHTSNTTTGLDAKGRLQNLSAWAVSNQEIKISGEVSSRAIATLYDLQGRAVSICPLQETNLNSMPLKGLKQGVYLLRVQDNSRVQVLKVNISK